MRTCPQCQRKYPDDAELCPEDATRLPAPPEAAETQIVTSLVGPHRYRIVKKLGAGWMGAVFLAEQIALGNRPVALKLLSRSLLDDPEFLLRFQKASAAIAEIRHLNVVTLYRSGLADDGTAFIAMQYLEGESLKQLLRTRGPLPITKCAEIVRQTARGLNAAHKLKIIHLDLKPDNIILTGYEGELVIKVVDFGLARICESAIHTKTGSFIGAPDYMSPEQASGMPSGELDARSDIYALGVVTYEMLSGRLPFQSDTFVGSVDQHTRQEPPTFRTAAPGLSISPRVEAVVMKALAKDRAKRFDSVLEFADSFEQATALASTASRAVRDQIRTGDEPPRPDQGTKSQSPAPPEALPGGALASGIIWENPRDELKYVWIPPGTFTMGCSPGDDECEDAEKPAHRVTITKGFWLGQTPVTAGAYKRFAEATGRKLPPAFNLAAYANEMKPMVIVTWEDAQAFCAWTEGRLPTEAEWEYAARGGCTQSRYGGLNEIAWYNGREINEVARKRANDFGLYDMLGNVWEWVNDRYDPDYYHISPSHDPQGPASGNGRSLRGGSWSDPPKFVRVSKRGFSFPAFGCNNFGFRCLREASSP